MAKSTLKESSRTSAVGVRSASHNLRKLCVGALLKRTAPPNRGHERSSKLPP